MSGGLETVFPLHRFVMVSTGLIGLLALVAYSVGFAVMSARRGTAFAFVALCWIPAAAFLLALLAHQELGYSLLLVVLLTLMLSAGLVISGIALLFRSRSGTPVQVWRLALGTVIAGAPIVSVLGAWAFQWLKGR